MRVGPVRTQMTNTQKMNIYETNTQNIPNLHVCSSEESELKRINADKTLSHVCSTDKSESRSIIVNACSTDKSKSKRVHISVNTSEVKDAMDETKYGESLVTDNSDINVPIYFKLFECGKKFLNNLDATYEQAGMETSQEIWDMAKLSYGRACMLYKKENYYTELSNTKTNFNENTDMPLSNVHISEAIMKVMMEDEE